MGSAENAGQRAPRAGRALCSGAKSSSSSSSSAALGSAASPAATCSLPPAAPAFPLSTDDSVRSSLRCGELGFGSLSDASFASRCISGSSGCSAPAAGSNPTALAPAPPGFFRAPAPVAAPAPAGPAASAASSFVLALLLNEMPSSSE